MHFCEIILLFWGIELISHVRKYAVAKAHAGHINEIFAKATVLLFSHDLGCVLLQFVVYQGVIMKSGDTNIGEDIKILLVFHTLIHRLLDCPKCSERKNAIFFAGRFGNSALFFRQGDAGTNIQDTRRKSLNVYAAIMAIANKQGGVGATVGDADASTVAFITWFVASILRSATINIWSATNNIWSATINVWSVTINVWSVIFYIRAAAFGMRKPGILAHYGADHGFHGEPFGQSVRRAELALRGIDDRLRISTKERSQIRQIICDLARIYA